MLSKLKIKENWLTKMPKKEGLVPTLFLILMLLFSSYIYLHNEFQASSWMSASYEKVFINHEWWRAWSTLFAHGDLSHIASNLFLFAPFSYFLISYFGIIYFPIIGFFTGGLINLIVLLSMPENVDLIGVSGVVYWMGGAWLMLAWLIDRRDSRGRRVLRVIAVTIVLFVPDSFKPEVSYLSHFLGYIFGIFSSIIFYIFNQKTILKEEVLEIIPEVEPIPWYDDYLKSLQEKEQEKENEFTNQ